MRSQVWRRVLARAGVRLDTARLLRHTDAKLITLSSDMWNSPATERMCAELGLSTGRCAKGLRVDEAYYFERYRDFFVEPTKPWPLYDYVAQIKSGYLRTGWENFESAAFMNSTVDAEL